MVHGGAWDIPDDAVEQHRRGVLAGLEQGWARLRDGGSAVDAVQDAVQVLEDDPTFDAGTGSMLNLEGHVELDAIVVRGQDLQAGAVAAVRDVRRGRRAPVYVPLVVLCALGVVALAAVGEPANCALRLA